MSDLFLPPLAEQPPADRPRARLHIGTSGWSYDDWKGVVYPARASGGWHPLDLLSCYFNTCEINVSFYRIPTAATAKSWVRRMVGHPSFLFTAKLWQGFTHDEAGVAPGSVAWREEADHFRAFADALLDGQRLGAILIQFPWSFRPTAAHRDQIAALAAAFRAYPLAIEVRRADWLNSGLLPWLRENRVSFVNIDQPSFEDTLPPTEEVTADFFYVRLHGRNRAEWFARESSVEQRYDYLYTEKELAPWVERIERMCVVAKQGFVLSNNHFRGQAVVNALQLAGRLGKALPAPPETLLQAYPVLRAEFPAVKTAPPPGGQLDLFA